MLLQFLIQLLVLILKTIRLGFVGGGALHPAKIIHWKVVGAQPNGMIFAHHLLMPGISSRSAGSANFF